MGTFVIHALETFRHDLFLTSSFTLLWRAGLSLYCAFSLVTMTSEVTLNLSESERRLFTLLERVALGASQQAAVIELRVAGGWVRDKLLGMESDDIDIAVSNITSPAFVALLKKEVPSLISGRAAVFDPQPEKGKHVQTATVNVFGYKLEFVQLRSDLYACKSILPCEAVGTPESDARQRDFTINALFYNIHTRRIEDLTGYG